MASKQEGGRGQRRCLTEARFTDDERRAGIVRLLAEAVCARRRKLGLLAPGQPESSSPLPLQERNEFLRGQEGYESAH